MASERPAPREAIGPPKKTKPRMAMIMITPTTIASLPRVSEFILAPFQIVQRWPILSYEAGFVNLGLLGVASEA